ncbi:hypothetical protein ACEWY4_026574 [Coilia grayii]|uniref:U5 small nuclear ribonucleoprotein TSSC4 n=1 Tax=Coilia grayii TaxID=363190 RepID=A0ABD1ISY6_9TELE
MCDPEGPGESLPNRLSNRDTIQLPDELSLSDSDPEDSLAPFGQRVEDLSSSSSDDGGGGGGVEEAKGPRPRGGARLPSGRAGDGGGGGVFQLRGGSLGFSDRSRSIFESLESAVKLTSAQLGDDNVLSGTFARPAPPSPPPLVRGRRSGTPPSGRMQPPPKQQGVPPQQQHHHQGAPAGGRVPDYLAHPERWTRYSLDDVPETSDRRNSQVAQQFLQGLQDQRRHQEDRAEPFMPSFNQSQASGGDQHKIVFSRPRLQGSREEGAAGRKGAPQRRSRMGLLNLGEEEDEEGARPEEARFDHRPPSSKEPRKRKWVPSRKWAQEDEDEEEPEEAEPQKPGNIAFSISKKVNRKHFRKMPEPQPRDEEEED